jgi:hypothetical protein
VDTYETELVNAFGESMTEVLRSSTDLAPDVQRGVVEAAKTATAERVMRMPGPDMKTASRLWTILVGTLALASLLSALCVGWAVLDGDSGTEPDVLVTIFTASLTGLVGLFVNPES